MVRRLCSIEDRDICSVGLNNSLPAVMARVVHLRPRNDGRESLPDGCAVPFDPLGERSLKRGLDADAGAVGGLFEPFDQIRRD